MNSLFVGIKTIMSLSHELGKKRKKKEKMENHEDGKERQNVTYNLVLSMVP